MTSDAKSENGVRASALSGVLSNALSSVLPSSTSDSMSGFASFEKRAQEVIDNIDEIWSYFKRRRSALESLWPEFDKFDGNFFVPELWDVSDNDDEMPGQEIAKKAVALAHVGCHKPHELDLTLSLLEIELENAGRCLWNGFAILFHNGFFNLAKQLFKEGGKISFSREIVAHVRRCARHTFRDLKEAVLKQHLAAIQKGSADDIAIKEIEASNFVAPILQALGNVDESGNCWIDLVNVMKNSWSAVSTDSKADSVDVKFFVDRLKQIVSESITPTIDSFLKRESFKQFSRLTVERDLFLKEHCVQANVGDKSKDDCDDSKKDRVISTENTLDDYFLCQNLSKTSALLGVISSLAPIMFGQKNLSLGPAEKKCLQDSILMLVNASNCILIFYDGMSEKNPGAKIVTTGFKDFLHFVRAQYPDLFVNCVIPEVEDLNPAAVIDCFLSVNQATFRILEIILKKIQGQLSIKASYGLYSIIVKSTASLLFSWDDLGEFELDGAIIDDSALDDGEGNLVVLANVLDVEVSSAKGVSCKKSIDEIFPQEEEIAFLSEESCSFSAKEVLEQNLSEEKANIRFQECVQNISAKLLIVQRLKQWTALLQKNLKEFQGQQQAIAQIESAKNTKQQVPAKGIDDSANAGANTDDKNEEKTEEDSEHQQENAGDKTELVDNSSGGADCDDLQHKDNPDAKERGSQQAVDNIEEPDANKKASRSNDNLQNLNSKKQQVTQNDLKIDAETIANDEKLANELTNTEADGDKKDGKHASRDKKPSPTDTENNTATANDSSTHKNQQNTSPTKIKKENEKKQLNLTVPESTPTNASSNADDATTRQEGADQISDRADEKRNVAFEPTRIVGGHRRLRRTMVAQREKTENTESLATARANKAKNEEKNDSKPVNELKKYASPSAVEAPPTLQPSKPIAASNVLRSCFVIILLRILVLILCCCFSSKKPPERTEDTTEKVESVARKDAAPSRTMEATMSVSASTDIKPMPVSCAA